MGTGDGLGHAVVVGQIGHFNLTEQSDGIGTEVRGVDDAGILEYTLFETDTTEQSGLFTLGGMILEVLAEIALVAGLCDGLTHLRQFYVLQLSEFGYELVIAFL